MSGFTMNDLREIMRETAGVEEGVDLDGDIAGVDFADLGYDSLAVLEMASQIKRRYGVLIPDDAAAELRTPDSLVTFVTGGLTGAGV